MYNFRDFLYWKTNYVFPYRHFPLCRISCIIYEQVSRDLFLYKRHYFNSQQTDGKK